MIHIIRNNAFGDVLWVEPVIRYFTENNKSVNIITWKPELFNNYPSKHLFVNYPLPKWQKSILKRIQIPGLPKVINLNGAYESNPKVHILKAYMEKSGIPDTVPLSLPRIYLDEQEKIAPYKEPYAVLHVEPHPINHRNVYGVDWKVIVDFIRSKGIKVVQLSKSKENLSGESPDTGNFRDVIRLINGCSFFIGLDSGPSHIASCLNKPSVIFFGSVNPYFRHLTNDNKVFLKQDCIYANCYHENNGGKEGSVCKVVGMRGVPVCCMQSNDAVIDSVERCLIRL